MAEYSIRYTQLAIDDLDVIFDYVAVENRNAAEKLLASFNTSILRLKTAPYLGTALRADEPMIISSGYRYLVVAPYMVFYRVVGTEVLIGRILHSRQDWLPLLFGR